MGSKLPTIELPPPPGAWTKAIRAAKLLTAPVERFLAIEAASGIVLLLAAAGALVWANSRFAESYAHLWHLPVGVRFASFSFERELHFWINDGLMTLFFFVVGLEIRREIHRGELSQLRRAALPLVAALGGMLVPAAIYLGLNHGRASQGGWGIPMATDIAFAVGVLALFGKRVPPALRILLLALAVIDDVGAIVVIALFYSSGIVPMGLLVAALGIVLTLALQLFGVRSPVVYVPAGVVIWAGAYASGIHPTLAGVVVGLLTPVHAWLGPERFLETAQASVQGIRERSGQGSDELFAHLDAIDHARREALPPLDRLLHLLHGWVAYGIMPLFAFANAGVTLGSASFEGDGARVFWGITLGLMLGKPIGVMLFSFVTAKVGVARLPTGVGWSKVSLVGAVAGIGFTMALFVAQLAFPPGPMLETAKLAILAGSAAAAVLSFPLGALVLRGRVDPHAAPSESAAERSTVG